MSGGFANPLVGGGGSLVYPAVHSPNYQTGVSGWTINKDGTVEFNSGTFRGTVSAGVFQGTDFIINSSGAFFYSGAPALGNLIASIASVAGTDSFGNAYQVGVTSYDNTLDLFLNIATGVINTNTIGASSSLAGLFTPGANGVAGWTTGLASLTDVAANIQLLSKQQANDANGPEIYLATRIVTAAVVAAANPTSNKVQETWHDTGGLQNGWGKGGGFFKYRMNPDGSVDIAAKDLNSNGATVADTTVILSSANGLPTAYRPSTSKRLVAYADTLKVSGTAFETAALLFVTDGSVQCFGIGAANLTVSCYGKLYIDI